ncbi:MAG: polyprenyl synthetase family protein [Candidatus Rokuibacteriota bacterium]|nr:MAG: polyprenyl synthetase family protein [Candidatus Rokubacteria bacterium]
MGGGGQAAHHAHDARAGQGRDHRSPGDRGQVRFAARRWQDQPAAGRALSDHRADTRHGVRRSPGGRERGRGGVPRGQAGGARPGCAGAGAAQAGPRRPRRHHADRRRPHGRRRRAPRHGAEPASRPDPHRAPRHRRGAGRAGRRGGDRPCDRAPRALLGGGDPDRGARLRDPGPGPGPPQVTPAALATPTLERVLKERVAALVGDDLAEVEVEIRRELSSPVPLIQEMGGYIAGAGGKRLRPILLLLAARLADYRGPRAVRLACVVELLHTATLIHDDVVDQAPLRRGHPSANARWGDDASVLVGDHLYSKSFAMLVRDNDRAVMETLARATVSMTEAEVFQLQLKRSGLISEADYVRIITQKTASFMSACCRIGALLGAVAPAQTEALTRYGLDIGIAFQISDDALDFTADQARLGKAIGADLREGKRTLPLIAMLERVPTAEAEQVRAALRRRTLDAAEIDDIRRLVLEHDGVGYARARALAFAQAAKADLEAFAPSEERETLSLVADFVVDRDR